MTAAHALSLVVVGGWLVLAWLVPKLPRRFGLGIFWALVTLGVPILGLLTFYWGPAAGLVGFATGLCVLFLQPTRPRSQAELPPLP